MFKFALSYPISRKEILRRLTAGGIFLLWIATFFMQAGLLLRISAPDSRKAAENLEDAKLVELPRSELARKIWLATHGARFGLTEDSDVDVVCTCTCCGDRCPMGASCCCSAEKIPVKRPNGMCSFTAGCAGQSPALVSVTDFKWYLCPDLFPETPFPVVGSSLKPRVPQVSQPALEPPTPVPKPGTASPPYRA